MAVRPHLLYRPLHYLGNLIPDPEAEHELFDRVINVREGFSVPLGLRGVIIGIQPGIVLGLKFKLGQGCVRSRHLNGDLTV